MERTQPVDCAEYQAVQLPVSPYKKMTNPASTAAGIKNNASRRPRVRQSMSRVVMIMTTRATTKNSPDTRTVQATAVIKAAASQRSDRARSHAQNAAAQNSASV
jgi:hypothetical protein